MTKFAVRLAPTL